jgi:hypothetical protein
MMLLNHKRHADDMREASEANHDQNVDIWNDESNPYRQPEARNAYWNMKHQLSHHQKKIAVQVERHQKAAVEQGKKWWFDCRQGMDDAIRPRVRSKAVEAADWCMRHMGWD